MEKELLTLKLENSELRHEVANLKKAVEMLSLECKESTKLLLQQRLPRRPHTSSTKKLLVAASQKFKCAGYPDASHCHLALTNDSVFDSALFEVDHAEMWSRSGRHTSQLQALCPQCHSRKTRSQLAQLESESDQEED